MSRLSDRAKVALAVIAALMIIAIPHVLTVDRGSSDTVEAGDVHPCSPLPDSDTYRIFVRNISCDEGTSIAQEVIDSPACRGGRCKAGENYKCWRDKRSADRLFWLCRREGGGAKVRFIISPNAPAGSGD